MINEITKNPYSIIVASRYTKGASLQKLAFIRRLISKAARTIVRHGLNITEVKDPLSGCFALPRQVVKNIEIDGIGAIGYFRTYLLNPKARIGNFLLKKNNFWRKDLGIILNY